MEENWARLAKPIMTAAPILSATPTMAQARANSPTTTSGGGFGLPGGYLWARLLFVAASTFVAWPSQWANYWGGSSDGSELLTATIAVTWTVLTLASQRLQQHDSESPQVAGALLLLDVVALTALLSLGGAAQNPFSMLYFVPITFSAVLTPRWTWRVAALSVCGFGLLLYQTSLTLSPHRQHPGHAHFFNHVVGMAIALSVVGMYVTFFVHVIARNLSAKRAQLQAFAEQQRLDRYAVALGTLAAGAAHELGSPLSSIQILAQELPHLDATERSEAEHTIVAEVQRMKSILHHLSATELSAETLSSQPTWTLQTLAGRLQDEALVVTYEGSTPCNQPLQVVVQILKELGKNARRASGGAAPELHLIAKSSGLEFEVKDHGQGMNEETMENILQPFYSTTGGTGLGLFLSSVHVRQLGGELSFSSAQGVGTCVRMKLPLHPPGWPIREIASE